jgi:hypothetical protein
MVKVGAFTVELVAADTKEPFKEHTAPDGQVYAEVEPGVDYFISTRTDVGGVKFVYYVDGVNLGYTTDVRHPKKARYCGKLERRGAKQTMTALHFNKTRETQDVTPDRLTGKVELKVYQRGAEYYSEAVDNFVSASLTADSTVGGKKCIKSTTSGSYSFDKLRSSKKRKGNMVSKHKRGERICTITLNYCSALGLIYHKILPPPPALQESGPSAIGGRKRKRSTTPSHVAVAAVSPEVNSHAAKTANNKGQEVTVQLTYDLVDLTGDD